MEYREQEILARVHQTGSDLYTLNEDGSLNEPEGGCEIVHDDQTVVWYEIAGWENEKTPFDSPQSGFCDSIDDAKKAIDWYFEQHPDEEGSEE